MVNQATNQEA